MRKENILKLTDGKPKKEKPVKVKRPINTALVKTVVGVMLIVLAIAGIFYWETIGNRAFNYTSVITVNTDIPAGTKIDASMLGTINYAKDSIVKDVVKDPKTIIGKTAVIDLPLGTQLTSSFFEDEALTIYTGDYVFAIPEDWIYNSPQSLRRGDSVFLYPVMDRNENTYYQGPATDNTPEYEVVTNPETGETMVVEVPKTQEDDPCKLQLVKATVCYVKDSSNKEVVDDAEIVADERINATSAPKIIEISVYEEDYIKMVEAYNKGYSFNILYAEKK